MFETLKFYISKKLGIYGEYDIINHKIKNYKIKSEELDNFLKICDNLINSIKFLLNKIETKLNNREIENSDLILKKFEIERVKQSYDIDVNKIILLEKKYRNMVKNTVVLYFNKLKNGEYYDNDLNNNYLDLISSSQILVSDLVFKKYFDGEMFFKEMLNRLVDSNNCTTIDDIEFILDKVETMKSNIYRENSMYCSNIVGLELSDKKQKYDILDDMYYKKRR